MKRQEFSCFLLATPGWASPSFSGARPQTISRTLVSLPLSALHVVYSLLLWGRSSCAQHNWAISSFLFLRFYFRILFYSILFFERERVHASRERGREREDLQQAPGPAWSQTQGSIPRP